MKSYKLVIIFLIILLFLMINSVYARIYDPVRDNGSYTYNFWGEVVPGPPVYKLENHITGNDIGAGELKDPQDIFITDDGTIYLVDSGNNRILQLDDKWKLKREIGRFTNGGTVDTFNNPSGIYIDSEGQLYIADQGNNRVVLLNQENKLIGEINKPEKSFAIPEDFVFTPEKLVVDPLEKVYVVARGVFDGIMVFNKDGVFDGFIGAPRVAPDPLDIFWKSIMTKEQKNRMARFLPTQYNSLDIDEKGFIYTTVAEGEIKKSEAIRKLTPVGHDVMNRNGFFPPIGDIEYPEEEQEGDSASSLITGPSRLVDIVVRQDGTYSALDIKRGHIFTYDQNGNLLYTFGGLGNKKGKFVTPVAIEYKDGKLIILDSQKGISIFKPTNYTLLIHQAISYYQQGNFRESTRMWDLTLKYNPGLSIAYKGIGRSKLREDKFREAMIYYKLANDREGYSKALRLFRREFVNDHFTVFFISLILAVIIIFLLLRFLLTKGLKFYEDKRKMVKKKAGNIWVKYLESIKYALYIIFHPFDGFWDLKHENRGNVLGATTILILVSISYILLKIYTGFLFNERNIVEINVYLEFISIILSVILWSAVNWSLTTLMEGKGTFKDIYIATSYALTPIILFYLPLIPVSHILTLEEGAFFQLALTIALIWAGLLVFFGTLVTHQYNIPKTFFTCLLTLIGMGIAIYIVLLFFNVIAQMVGYIKTIYYEISMRI